MNLDFERVTKKYGRRLAVSDVSFSLSPGKIYGILGPNGSGKSTTLKMLAGLAFPTSGAVRIGDCAVSRNMLFRTAYLTEHDMFFARTTVGDMLTFYHSQFPDFQLEKAHNLLTEMNLSAGQKIKELSKGSRGRLKIVLALSRKASVILLDEPFSGLDPAVRESIVNSLVSYIDFDSQIVVIATHEIGEIETLLDEVMVFIKGKIAERREVEEIREQEGMSVLQWYRSVMQAHEIEGGF
ncbi:MULTISPECIES: ATP-binding cassette domain-containing protein [Bacillus]|uniref:ATP-binding cassette domain-containing protein n=1 Tax=Bacillus TaxID=1386 RepID=UPI0007507467|nr:MULTISPECIES: ABC transporter ATP-binding protein [Bacillus amyloliquefaciens group]ANB83065.1 spermidine/putrescine ABC transporter ATP-binding protein [Bacillus velezensis]KUP43392.1 spermidine/putrescine ABC transporter ATP-binding protein [Bacillus velezensis]MED1773473.1 ABC transporter ATP-binding protein [Bacillus velezensis]PRS82291.1 ABC transporter ATP-binding protein [Bacillus velezensis]QEK96266.1 ABC transporter ATP-binding protein [Bacillus amyloliquefaciens]